MNGILPKTLRLVVKPRAFLHADGYQSNFNCPLAITLREKIKGANISVGGASVYIGGTKYLIPDNWKRGNLVQEYIDRAKAKKHIQPWTVILTQA